MPLGQTQPPFSLPYTTAMRISNKVKLLISEFKSDKYNLMGDIKISFFMKLLKGQGKVWYFVKTIFIWVEFVALHYCICLFSRLLCSLYFTCYNIH